MQTIYSDSEGILHLVKINRFAVRFVLQFLSKNHEILENVAQIESGGNAKLE